MPSVVAWPRLLIVILSTTLECHSIATNVNIDEYYAGDAGDWEHRTAAIGGAATEKLLGRWSVQIDMRDVSVLVYAPSNQPCETAARQMKLGSNLTGLEYRK